jgi:hypothetical protein
MPYLIILILAGVYGWVGSKVWSGFRRTNFDQSFPTKLTMTLLWPVLLIANKSYRNNFQKALKGSRR